MISTRAISKSFFILQVTIIIFEKKYLLPPAEAVNGFIWSKNTSDFVKIFSIRSFDKINKERLSISRKLENHDYNGAQFKFTSFPITDLVNFVSNDTVTSGAHGDMWQVLSTMLNFKIRNIKLNENAYGIRMKNGSWNGVIGYVYRNDTDIIPRVVISPDRLGALQFTLGTWITGYRFYMKKQLQYHKAWIIELFSPKLWFSIIGLFFTLVFAHFIIDVLNHKDKKTPYYVCDLKDHFFYIFSIFCNQGAIPKQLENRSKILIISTRLFSWLLVIAFSSQLISRITYRDFNAPFHDLESFYKDTDYKLIVQRDSFVYSVFASTPSPIYKTIMNSGRLIQASMLDAYEMTCTGKYVYLEVQDVVEANRFKGCEMNFIGKSYFNTWITGGLFRGFKYKKTIDLGILKLHEFGIINQLKSKWLTKTTMTDKVKVEAIRLEHVSLMFAMLCCAALLSLVILLIENMVHLGHIQQNRRKPF